MTVVYRAPVNGYLLRY